MKKAPLPEDEENRLKALAKYNILDTEAEKVFDELTELASEICGTPIALISLVDPDRQWFKSTVGVDASETHRDIAFCAHAILQERIFEVVDTLQDDRFKDNPLVTDQPCIRAYAGAPLITPDGYAIGTLCAIDDKPHKLNEHQKKALKILSKQVISQLELRLKVKEVELANQRKTDFLSNLSHELRTPLNAIVSFSQLMLNDKNNSELSEKYRQYIEHIDFSGQKLLSLVNSILDINKIESGNLKIALDCIEIDSFFKSIESMIQALALKKSIKLDFRVDNKTLEYFCFDETRLTQIILNLASNAIKFSDDGQTVDINIVFTSSKLIVAVKDRGIGIAEDDIPMLFNKFQKVGNSKNYDGSGLGLMITKELVELMQGNIKLTSKLGYGTLFKVELPIVPYKKSESKQQTNTAIHDWSFDTNAKILVVEDNFINQEIIKEMFLSIGLEITLCDSGEKAIDEVKKGLFDLIFMDLHLPGLTVLQTSQQIIEANPQQIIVALSADVFAESDSLFTSGGIKDSITKPASVTDLLKVLNKYCPNQH